MKSFVFSAIVPETEGSDETEPKNKLTVFETILNLVNFKNLRIEVLTLIKTLTKFCDGAEIISQDDRYEMFINIFNKSKKVVVETAELMIALDVDFWYEIVKMMNYYVEEDVDVVLLLTSVENIIPIDPETLMNVVLKFIKEPQTARRAAEIFAASFKLSLAKDTCLNTIIGALEKCATDETTFTIVLQALMQIDDEILVDFLKANKTCLIKTLMPCISNALVDFNKPSSLNIIVASLKKLYTIEPIIILPRVRELADGYYKIIKGFKSVEFSEREKLVPKLSAIFECKSWNLMQYSDLLNLYEFCQKYCSNINYNYFPQFQRFYMNLLKHFWMLMLAEKPSMVMKSERFIKETRNFYQLIQSALKNSKNNVADNCLLLSSLMDLYVFFQPNMKEKCAHEIFQQFHFPLTKPDLLILVDQTEANVFVLVDNEDSFFYQQSLMQSFVTFQKNYINLPSVTAWEVVLRHYNSKSPHKEEIEAIMNQAMAMKKSIFEKSVAFTILNLAQEHGIERFRPFYTALEDFMRRTFEDVKHRSIVVGVICSIVLDRFSKAVATMDNGENRLVVLDFIILMVKSSDQSFANNLLKYVNINENALSNTEKRQLEEFKNKLSA